MGAGAVNGSFYGGYAAVHDLSDFIVAEVLLLRRDGLRCLTGSPAGHGEKPLDFGRAISGRLLVEGASRWDQYIRVIGGRGAVDGGVERRRGKEVCVECCVTRTGAGRGEVHEGPG